MRNKRITLMMIAVLGCVGMLSGCAGTKHFETALAHPCDASLPDTNSMSKAVARAEEILQECPDRQEVILLELIEIGKRNPGIENRSAILALYKQLIEFEVVNVKEAKELMTRYFYTRFAAVDGVHERFSSLSDRALDRLSMAIEDELALKEIGLKEVSDAPEQYEKAHDYAERMQDLLESTKIQWSHLRKEHAP